MRSAYDRSRRLSRGDTERRPVSKPREQPARVGVALTMTTLGIIGAGHIGSQVARAAVKSGYEVVIANSRGPETLEGLIAELGPHARAATAAEAATAADIAVVTVPFKAYGSIPVEPLAGKIVIDTDNYYWERDGHVPALDEGRDTVTGMLQKHLATSHVAKGFNHITAADITTDGRPAGDPARRALATASDHEDAAAFVTSLYDEFGFDTVNVGPLDESWRVERDQPAYESGAQTRDELAANLAKAKRITSAG
ncbi:NADPH-dependent F420 reductase [Agromyces sp. S2-1-8]|uniref:NADPH-dependent F420 reductase n=1 Tax=unclassified Agromyces TaxID=2639701 RepID=UPI001E3126E5|nr:NAD(P)-binding domain-containing protein [Agromyces sp. S2-1-8]MCD5346044.1 NAD(P)-binding domain-containing protein [Agromyces sp. S2-1-8]